MNPYPEVWNPYDDEMSKAYRETAGQSNDASDIIRPDPQMQFIRPNKSVPPTRNQTDLIRKYSGWAYICASRNASALASVNLRLYATRATGEMKAGRGIKSIGRSIARKDMLDLRQRFPRHKALQQSTEVEEILEHPLLDLITNVNSVDNHFDVFEKTSIFSDCLGNAYWYVVRDGSGKPVEFWPLMAQWVTIVPDPKLFIKGYLYGLDPRTQVAFDVADIIHFKTPNPLSLFYGLGCIESASFAIDRYRAMDTYEQSLNENMGIPSVWIQYKTGTLDEKKRRELETQWNSRYRGSSKSGKVAVTDMEYDIKTVGLAPREMGFSEGRKWTRLEIADAFGVPLALLDTENVNLANAKTALYQYAKFTILPRIARFQEKLNERLVPMYEEPRLLLAFDNCVPADDEFQLKKDSQYLSSNVITVNEVRAREGWEPVEWGDSPVVATSPEPDVEDEDDSDEVVEKPEKAFVRVKSLPEGTSEPSVILNALLASEHMASFIYTMTGHIVMGQARTVIATEYFDHARQEAGHATKLIDRLQALGLPITTSMAEVMKLSKWSEANLPTDSAESLALNKRLEIEAVQDYAEAIRLLYNLGDSPTILMLMEIMGEEQAHKHELEQLESEISGQKSLGYSGVTMIQGRKHFSQEHHTKAGHVLPLTKNQKRLAKSMGAVFAMQESAALKWVSDHKDALKPNDRHELPHDILGKEWDGVVVKMTSPHIKAEIDNGIKVGLGKIKKHAPPRKAPIGVQLDEDQWVNRPEIGDYVRTHNMKFAQEINAKTNRELKSILSDALDEGKSIAGIEEDIEGLFKGYEDYRIERIARTESARAQVGGERKVYKDSGVVHSLKWLASSDACEFCLEMDGKTVGIDQDFFKQGQSLDATDDDGKEGTMDFDYGDVEGPPLHPNCRCDLIPEVIGADEVE